MKKTFWTKATFALIFAFAFPSLALAADAAPALQDLAGQLNLAQIFKFTAAAILGAALSPNLQAIIEHTVAAILDGALPFWAKPFSGALKSMLPTILAFVAGKLAVILGVDPAQAYTAAITLSGGTHVVNASTIAADKGPGVEVV